MAKLSGFTCRKESEAKKEKACERAKGINGVCDWKSCGGGAGRKPVLSDGSVPCKTLRGEVSVEKG